MESISLLALELTTNADRERSPCWMHSWSFMRLIPSKMESCSLHSHQHYIDETLLIWRNVFAVQDSINYAQSFFVNKLCFVIGRSVVFSSLPLPFLVKKFV